MPRTTRCIRISADLAGDAQEIGRQFGRRMSAQVEYWARIGKAYTEGTGIAIPPPSDPPPEQQIASPLPDEPPKPMLTPLEVNVALWEMVRYWKSRVFSDPRPTPENQARFFELIARGERLGLSLSPSNGKSIDEARSFVSKYQSTYKDETDSP